MGVSITELLSRKDLSLNDLKNKTIAIDSSIFLYQFLTTIRQRDGSLLTDSKGRVTSHLTGLFSRNCNLMKNKLKLIYVFDGESPKLKEKERQKRRESKEYATAKYEIAKKKKDVVGMKKFAARTTRLTKEMIDDAKSLIEAFGLPIIQAKSEGEAQAAYLVKQKEAYAVASQDADSLLFESPKLIRNLSVAKNKPELINLKETLAKLGITQDQLIVLGMLIGSVDYNEPTIIKNNSIIKVLPIGKCPTNHPLEVPCFDIKTKKIKFKKVKKFIKHKINEPLYEITTTYNRKVKVTKSHSLFIKNNKGIEVVRTTNLKKGDKLVIPVKIPHQNKEIKEINIALELWRHKNKIKRLIYCDGKNIQEIRKRRLLNKDKRFSDKRYILTKLGLEKLKNLRIEKRIVQRKTLLSESTILDWEKGRRNPTKTKFKEYLNSLGTNIKEFNKNKKYIKKIRSSSFEENIFPLMSYKNKNRRTLLLKSLSKEEITLLSHQDFVYGRTREKNPFSSIIKITPELIRLIGYFLAEGHLNNNYRVNFSFAPNGIGHDDYCVNDVIYCIKKIFKTTPKVYHEKSTRHVCLDNCVIHDFFAYILGLEKQNSKTKIIPSLIFNINSQLQLEFLKGLFLGDGSLCKNSISFNTASYDLAVGLSYIFLQQGILFSTTFQNEKNYNMKNLYICGKDQLIKTKKIWKKHHKANILINYCKKPLRQKPECKINNDLGYVKIKSITKVKPTDNYVYDFSVDGENFIAGFGGICCHNTDYNIGGIKGIGKKNALKLVKKYDDFNKLFKDVKWEDYFTIDWKDVFHLFKKMPITKKYSIKFNEIDKDKIIKILVDKHDFSLERIENKLNELMHVKKQKGLGDWF